MNKEPYELGHKLKLGALWSYINTGGITFIQFISGIIMARILDPEDFGVFIAVSAYTTLLQIQIRFGMPLALVQRKDLSREQFNQAFWLMEFIAIASTILVFLLSEWLGGFYNDKRYPDLMKLMCVIFFVVPFISINTSLLRRKMEFKTISQIGIIAALTSVPVGIGLALAGLGPYSFAWGGITATTVTSILMYRKAPWKPTFPETYKGFAPIFSYAWKSNINNSLETLANRADNMLIGSLLSTHLLGIYNRAFSLSRMPVDQLAVSLRPVIISALSRIQDDIEQSTVMNQKVLCGTSLIVFPLLALLICTADSIISTLYGEKWLMAAAPLKIMAVGSFATALTVALRAMIASQNLVGKEVPIQLLNLGLTVAVVVAGYSWGLNAIAAGIALKELIVFLLIKRVLMRSHVKMRIGHLIEAIFPPLTATVITTLILLVTQNWLNAHFGITSFQYLLVSTTELGAIYLLSLVILAKVLPNNKIFHSNLDIARRYIQSTLSRFRLNA